MKKIIFAALMIVATASAAHAEAAPKKLSCRDAKISAVLQTNDDGTIVWTVTRLKTGRSEEFMGFITSDEVGSEFYSTDQGSDLTFTQNSAVISLEGHGPSETHKLVCSPPSIGAHESLLL